MAAMKCSALRNPKERSLIALILLFHTLNGAIRNPRPGPCENPISRGEFIINGFRDKDLQDLLYPKHRAIRPGIAPALWGDQP
jgi:hypothetical protein